MTHRIIIAGEGGQGIMLLGKVLAEAAMAEGRFVTYLPAYGAEVRGGTANCMVIVSDTEIGSPLVQEADSLIIMNEPSFVRFAGRLSKKGTAFVNSSLVANETLIKRSLQLPFTETAIRLGNQKCANMVALGCFCAQTKLIDIKGIIKIVEEHAQAHKKEFAALNKKALEAGAGLCQNKRL